MPRSSGRASSRATRKMGSVMSVGSASVRWRVIVRNELSRIFTATVPARTPADRRRPATPSAIASSVRSIISRSVVSTSNVCSWPTDFAGSPSWTGSASMPARPLDERRAVLAEAPHDDVRRRAPPGRRSSGRRTRRAPRAVARRRPTGARSAAARGTPPPRPAARRRARRACAGPRRSSRRAWSSRPRPTRSGRRRRGPRP